MDKKKIKKIAIIVGVLLLPLIYSITYLKGFWDPYNNLGNIKVAVVNEDKCTKDCKSDDLIKKLKDSDSFNFIVKDKKEAEDGLINKKYYATITIPEDFTKSFDNVESKDRSASTITYRPNKKTNYIASQLIENAVIRVEKELDTEVAKEVVGTLTDKLNEVPEQTEKISDALGTIYTGTVTLNNGAQKLSSGTKTLNDNSKKITEGIEKINNGLSTLSDGTTKLKSGANELATATTKIASGSTTIKNSVSASNKNLTTKKQVLNTKLTEFVTQTNQYSEVTNTVLNNMDTYLKSIIAYYSTKETLTTEESQILLTARLYTSKCSEIVPLLSANPNYAALAGTLSQEAYKDKTILEILKDGSAQIKNGSTTLATTLDSAFNEIITNMNTLESVLTELSTGANELNNKVIEQNGLVDSINRLDSGVKELYNGTNTLNTSYKTFDNGVNTLNNSVGTLTNGTNTLSNGVNTAKTSVEDATEETKEKLKDLEGLDTYTSKPVNFKEKSYGEVKDYGTFFSPFFMSLSLWLGGILIIMGLYYDPEHRFDILSKNSTNRPKRLVYYTIIGIAQSIILPIILVLALHFTVTNWFLFYASCILIGLSFLSIMLFLVFNFDDIGKFLCIVLLVVQLAACAGTFPLETEPSFFSAISPFMPMTYSVELLRESFVSIDSSILTKDIFILSAILVVFGTLIFITGAMKTKKEKLTKKAN